LLAADDLIVERNKRQGMTSLAADDLIVDRNKCQGTTLVVPQMQLKRTRALAPEGMRVAAHSTVVH
jgi:hypothetical protein